MYIKSPFDVYKKSNIFVAININKTIHIRPYWDILYSFIAHINKLAATLNKKQAHGKNNSLNN